MTETYLFSPYAARAPETCPHHDAPFTSKQLVKVCSHKICRCPYAQRATYKCGCTVTAIPDDKHDADAAAIT